MAVTAAKRVCVSEIFDTGSITPMQIRVFLLCLCIVFFDGFDLVVISVALPKISAFLHVGMAGLGLAVGAGQLGPLVGAMLLGSMADRFGRKRMLLISAIIFGVFTIMIATITSVEQLALFRFLSGSAWAEPFQTRWLLAVSTPPLKSAPHSLPSCGQECRWAR